MAKSSQDFMNIMKVRNRILPATLTPIWILFLFTMLLKRLWARFKEWRAVATRYDKTAHSFLGVLCLAAAIR